MELEDKRLSGLPVWRSVKERPSLTGIVTSHEVAEVKTTQNGLRKVFVAGIDNTGRSGGSTLVYGLNQCDTTGNISPLFLTPLSWVKEYQKVE